MQSAHYSAAGVEVGEGEGGQMQAGVVLGRAVIPAGVRACLESGLLEKPGCSGDRDTAASGGQAHRSYIKILFSHPGACPLRKWTALMCTSILTLPPLLYSYTQAWG
jgi:hypothetical protein